MLTLHHLNNSRSQRVLWLLEELGVPYRLQLYTRDPRTMLAPPELAAVHPLGKSPVLEDGDRLLAESAVIIEYMIDHYGDGRFGPVPGTDARLDQSYWLYYAEGSLMPLLLLKLVFTRIAQSPAPFFVKPLIKGIAHKAQANFGEPQLVRQLDYVDAHLKERDWFLGDTLSGADFQMSFPLQAAKGRVGLARWPHIDAFVNRVESREAYRRALDKGGPFSLG
ncbi:glutathione S-transferase family protein [Robbsia andropogonis]|uniref:glutathione S-transferase family protein n=1 Tax=Robbsia andropogonis TaxID=28092 RepID=UPI002A6A2EAC|nr:glutathione S-transferase [Robbsia andropogonis]